MQKNKLIASISILFLVCSSSLSAQGVWKNYTNGNEINDIAIEGDYIWCATTGGVVRWDRRDGSYVKYTSADGLSHNNVTCVAIGPDNMKWFGTGYGVSRFDGYVWKTYVLSENEFKERSGRNWVASLAIGMDGEMWAGSSSSRYGISHFDGDSWTCCFEFLTISKLANAMMVDENNTVWINTDRGCFYYLENSSVPTF